MAYCSNLLSWTFLFSNSLGKHYVSEAGSASVFRYRKVPNLPDSAILSHWAYDDGQSPKTYHYFITALWL